MKGIGTEKEIETGNETMTEIGIETEIETMIAMTKTNMSETGGVVAVTLQIEAKIARTGSEMTESQSQNPIDQIAQKLIPRDQQKSNFLIAFM